jgi:peroxiredoxin
LSEGLGDPRAPSSRPFRATWSRRSCATLLSVLKVQSRAPDFTVRTTDGRTLKLSDLRGRHVVLFFFPKAFTGG